MTDRQQKFADEYIIDCNASRAYKAAYPNVKKDTVARANGSRLLAKANIKAYIEEKLAEISSKKTAEATEVIEYLTSVLRGQSEASVVVVEGYGDGCSEAKIIKATGRKGTPQGRRAFGQALWPVYRQGRCWRRRTGGDFRR